MTATPKKKTKITPTANTLPKRNYYTLQQAADELNKYFKSNAPNNNQPIIDIDYLIHMGVNAKISLYFNTSKEIEAFCFAAQLGRPDNTLKTINEILQMHFTVDRSVFLNIHTDDLSKIEIKGHAHINRSTDLRVNYSLIFHPQFNSLNELAKEISLEYKEEDKINHCTIMYFLKKNNENEMLLENEDNITKESLYIFSDHLDAFKNNELPENNHKSKMIDEVIEQDKRETATNDQIKAALADLVGIDLKEVRDNEHLIFRTLLKLANLDAMPIHTAADKIINYALSQGLPIPSKSETIAKRFKLKDEIE